MNQIEIHVIQHKKTGLLAAISSDLEGFIVHAHSEGEMLGKLETAVSHYMDAIGKPVRNVRVVQKTPEGFWPPTYSATSTPDLVDA